MNITPHAEYFNMIMKARKPFVEKKAVQPIYTRIEFTCDGETVTAVALNDASLLRCTAPCENGSGMGKRIVPLMKPVEKTVRRVLLSDTDKEITAHMGESSQTFRKVAGDWVKIEYHDPHEDHYRCIVLSDDTIRKALVLPMRDPNKR